MSLLPIVEVGDPVLREMAGDVSREELESDEVQGFIDDMIETMRGASGAGLAANQVGSLRRIAVVEVPEGGNPRYPYKPPIPLTVMVNPVLEPVGRETFEVNEGCLSVPRLRGVVDRYEAVRVRYLDRLGAPVEEERRGLTAGTFQHEVDHLDGVLFLDRVRHPETFTTWEQFERFGRAEFEAHARALVERLGS
jgi:peptide deformylase